MPKPIAKSTLRLTEGAGRKLLAGHVTETIEAGTVLVLTRTSETDYELHAVTVDDGDPMGPSTLASFLPPDEVDAAELLEAIHRVVDPASKPRRTRKRRSTTKSKTKQRNASAKA